ncbi:MAG: hypothetical protein JWP61_2145, partial [Friedmanniella sp.]|nr:hypothetical protein [Friedmanniella sp.]
FTGVRPPGSFALRVGATAGHPAPSSPDPGIGGR